MSTTWPRWLWYIIGLGWQIPFIWAPNWLRRFKAKKVIAVWSWPTLTKMTLFLYLAKLKFSPGNLLQSQNEPNNILVWHCTWCKSIVCIVFHIIFCFSSWKQWKNAYNFKKTHFLAQTPISHTCWNHEIWPVPLNYS